MRRKPLVIYVLLVFALIMIVLCLYPYNGICFSSLWKIFAQSKDTLISISPHVSTVVPLISVVLAVIAVTLSLINIIASANISKQNHATLERIEVISNLLQGIKYTEKAQELYMKSLRDDCIYACTTTWPSSLDKSKNVFIKMEAKEIIFFGKIKEGYYFPRVLQRTYFNEQRTNKFTILDRKKEGLKFIVVGNKDVLLSQSGIEDETRFGFHFKDSQHHAQFFTEQFKRMIRNAKHYEERINDIIKGVLKAEKTTVRTFCDDLWGGRWPKEDLVLTGFSEEKALGMLKPRIEELMRKGFLKKVEAIDKFGKQPMPEIANTLIVKK